MINSWLPVLLYASKNMALGRFKSAGESFLYGENK
jgi:hypothetical protein